MSLNVYTKKEDIPKEIKFVQCNDLYFKVQSLRDDEYTKQVLKEIDKAEYNSPETFIGRDKELGAMYKQHLSTGTKTLLNIYYSPDICFDVIECGINALRILPLIKNGNVYWKYPVMQCMMDYECDIIIDGKKFNKVSDFLHYTMDAN